MEELTLIDWLLSPIDPERPHLVSVAESWHARLMVVAWGVLLPVGVLIARYFKITPKQNWPSDLDNRLWWHSHLWLQWSGAAISLGGLFIILRQLPELSWLGSAHHFFGWLTLALMLLQIGAGLFRGSKGGPTYPAPDGSWRGDHFDMTKRRRTFEYSHKSLGYIALLCGALAILLGLYDANAPVWMWAAILIWWAVLMGAALVLQLKLGAIDTYQAIWGPDPELPGNKRKPIGIGVKRLPPGGQS